MNKEDIRICFMGTPEFASTVLLKLIEDGYNVVLAVTQVDKPVGRKHIITPPPLKVVATEHNIPVYQPLSLKDDEAYEKIKGCSPDIIVTAAYGKILPQRILDIPTIANINVHASLLPKYRGASPVQTCILNGDVKTGITIMMMDVGMDTGDILTQEEVIIDENIHYDQLMEKLSYVGAKLLSDALPDFVEGKISPVKQDESKVVCCYPIKAEQGMFTWDMNAKDIHNIVRALSTWPGAYVITGDKKLKVYDTQVVKEIDFDVNPDFAPGTIVKAHKSDLIIKCKDESYLKINELQIPGGKRLKASDCAHNFKVGSHI